jgi:ribosomal protein S18 acetylase RimI-like enzyme
MGVRLRTLDTTDAPLLAAYLQLSIFVRPGEPPPRADTIEQPALALYVDGWGRYGDDGVLAIDVGTGGDVGAAWLRLWPGPETGYGYVDRATPELAIAVRPEHRGRGIGACLLDALIDRASVRHRSLSLSVSPDNPAVRLYERFGFAVTSDAGGSLTMWRRLGSPR